MYVIYTFIVNILHLYITNVYYILVNLGQSEYKSFLKNMLMRSFCSKKQK